MAFKSPGIYYTETDNTEYTNPAAEINTTVAIIGFAKKGPIGEPTEITSWSQFKSTFGSPITGEFAPLAVRNVLSNGGTVLFVRIADESLASSSAVVLKTETSATNGTLIFNRTSIPAAELKSNGFYVADISANATSEEKRPIFFRSPAEGYLSSYNLLEQLQASLSDYYGFSEYKFKVTSKPDSADDNWRFFSLKYNSLITSDESLGDTENDTIGPFAVKLTTARATNGAALASAINDSLENGTVPYTLLDIGALYFKSSVEDTTNSTNNSSDDEYSSVSLTADNFDTISDFSAFDAENEFYFNFKNENNELLLNNTTYAEQIAINEVTYPITFTISDGKLYLSAIVASLNKALNASGIAVKTVITPVLTAEGDTTVTAKLLFFRTNASAETTEINNSINSSSFVSFLKITDDATKVSTAENDLSIKLTSTKPVSLVLVGNSTFSAITAAAGIVPTEASYNSDSNTIVFQATASDLIASEKDSTVALADPGFGYYLSQTSVSDGDANYYFVTKNNKSAIGDLTRTVAGQDASEYSIRKNSNGVVEIYLDGQLEHPVIYENTSISNGINILSLFGDTAEDYSDDTADNEVVLYKDGNPAESASEHARIGFIAKEYGEGTTGIGIEIYTSISPLDDVTETHYIDVYVDGVKKESWEDVSYNPSDSNFIVTLINEDPLNGGSSYITAVYDMGSSGDEVLDIQDTANYTDTGIVYLGQALYDSSKAATTSTNLSNVESYDYAIGNNGAVTDSTSLYLNALETTNSPLSNKDLYSWHILITPDNISAEVQDQAVSLCEYMDDGIYIADPPEALTRKAVINWHNGRLSSSDRVSALNSNFVCTYWPWVKIYDATSSKYVWAPPSVVMAPQFVKVDNAYAPWYAPAGETNGLVSTVIDIEESPNKTDRDALYLDQNRVNPFLKLRNGNILAYGEKTCQRKNSTLTKIHTRRMLIALKKELRNSIKGYIFMPTMTENITEIKAKVTAIMESYKQGGGVDSYVVVCDGTNNTTETLQQDILNIDISCVPVGCLEQIEISLTLNKSAETTE